MERGRRQASQNIEGERENGVTKPRRHSEGSEIARGRGGRPSSIPAALASAGASPTSAFTGAGIGAWSVRGGGFGWVRDVRMFGVCGVLEPAGPEPLQTQRQRATMAGPSSALELPTLRHLGGCRPAADRMCLQAEAGNPQNTPGA